MKSVAVLLLAIVSVAIAISEAEHQEAFNAFKIKFNKNYRDISEEAGRYAIFKENHRFIEKHNAKGLSYKVGINRFADMSKAEFAAKYLTLQNNTMPTSNLPPFDRVEATPTSWTWVGKAVTPVKFEGDTCGASWAFSATGAMEGCLAIATGKLIPLSEQNLVDCTGDGCDGGLMNTAFQYVVNNGGLDFESCYPYTANQGACQYQPSCCSIKIKGFVQVAKGSESALQAAVYTTPVSVAVDADGFQLYTSGVFNDPECSPNRVNYAVLVVGWGVTQGQEYWIVKNQWGEDWGVDGYIWMAKNKNNACGIATAASFPDGCGSC